MTSNAPALCLLCGHERKFYNAEADACEHTTGLTKPQFDVFCGCACRFDTAPLPSSPVPPEQKSLLRDPVKVDVSTQRTVEPPPVIVTRDGIPCADQSAALEEFKERCRVSAAEWRCERRPWPCRYPSARQCAHDTMLGSECPKACECECHDPAATPTPVEQEQKPINVILFCPRCGTQHVDAPESEETFQNRMQAFGLVAEPQDRFPSRWTNPPHKSHLCHNCYAVWRPADVPTNGVAQIKTRGKEDNTWTNSAAVPPSPSVREAAEGRTIDKTHRETGIPMRALETAFELSTLGMLDEDTAAGMRVIPDAARVIAQHHCSPVSAAGGDEESLQQRCFAECATANWDPDKQNTFAEEIAHLHEELSEAFRAWRRYKDCRVVVVDGKPEGVPIELADVLIGLFYNAELHGFDLLAAVEQKHQFNLRRNYVKEGRQLHAADSVGEEGK